MLDVAGTELTDEDRRRLAHPRVGGVILFARNYESPRQLRALTHAIRNLRDPPLLIAADHEGGRVQRFRSGFTAIPPMRHLGQVWDSDQRAGESLARAVGSIIGTELSSHGVDFSFAPVLDLDYGSSSVIGDRALHSDAQAVAALGTALIEGLGAAGVRAVAKHFPGHGYVRADTHHEVATDARSFAQIEQSDLVPFARLAPLLGGVMPAHVIYPAVDALPAGYSPFWLQQILRMRLAFQGVIFSDDLSMEGAQADGGIQGRVARALNAGCNMVLVCNAPDVADELLAAFPPYQDHAAALRMSMHAATAGALMTAHPYRDNLELLSRYA